MQQRAEPFRERSYIHIYSEALEDARDLDEVREALADPANRDRIAWDDLKAQLGL